MNESIYEQLEAQRKGQLRKKLARRHLPVEALMELERYLRLNSIRRISPSKDDDGRTISPGAYVIRSVSMRDTDRELARRIIDTIRNGEGVASATYFINASAWEAGSWLSHMEISIVTKEDMDAVDPEARIENPCIS